MGSEAEEESCSVKVAIRIRPSFSDSVDLKSILKIGSEKSVEILRKDRNKTFSFDRVYGPEVSQNIIFGELGEDVLRNAFDGYNSCVFAYGQTGSGKTYSMMGDTLKGKDGEESEKDGMIPRLCRELFRRVKSHQEADSSVSYNVEVSYIEIYQEKVRDLLCKNSDGNQGSFAAEKSFHNCRIREHPIDGPYVENLTKLQVLSSEKLLKIMEHANKLRTTAETAMNQVSSRSHSIFSISLKCVQVVDSEALRLNSDLSSDIQAASIKCMSHERQSKISLVDLAGSERVKVSKTSGHRLKEGASINKSLSTLGLVIKALVERSREENSNVALQNSRTGRRVFVPYRDSILTWLLKESLGGNSKTIMLATVSPEETHFEETLSTLRYATHAKHIVNKAHVNEDETLSKVVVELRNEVEKLRAQLALYESGNNSKNDDFRDKEEIRKLKEELKNYELSMVDLKASWETKLREAHDKYLSMQNSARPLENPQSVDSLYSENDPPMPHLLLENGEKVIDLERINYLRFGDTSIGSDLDQDIVLRGAQIDPNHAIITLNESRQAIIKPPEISRSNSIDVHLKELLISEVSLREIIPKTYVNGTEIFQEPKPLFPGDRIMFGKSHVFTYVDPAVPRDSDSGIEKGEEALRSTDIVSDSGFFKEASPKSSKIFGGLVTDPEHVSKRENSSQLKAQANIPSFSGHIISSISIRIPNYEVKYETGQSPYVVYNISITLSHHDTAGMTEVWRPQSWEVWRRFKEFHGFHIFARNFMPPVLSQNFPTKGIWKGGIAGRTSPQLLEMRRKMLEDYLNAMCSWWIESFSFRRLSDVGFDQIDPIDESNGNFHRTRSFVISREELENEIPLLSAHANWDDERKYWRLLSNVGTRKPQRVFTAPFHPQNRRFFRNVNSFFNPTSRGRWVGTASPNL